MIPTSGVGGAAVAFNPSLHPRAPAGGPAGGQFAAGGSGSKAAPAKGKPPAKKTPPPNGLGYSSAQWAQLQKLEAMANAGKKLDAHQQHMLTVAHRKRLAATAKAKPAAKKTTVKAKPKTAARPKATVKKTTAKK